MSKKTAALDPAGAIDFANDFFHIWQAAGVPERDKRITPSQVSAMLGASRIDLAVRGLSSANTAAANAAILNAANIEAAALGATIKYPAGIFQHSGVTGKNKTHHSGCGRDTGSAVGTVLLYTGTGDGYQLNNPLNSSTAANTSFERITFKNANRNPGKGVFADTGSTDIKFRLCDFVGSDRGLILDQSELVDVTECGFEGVASQTCLAWLVSGADRSPGGGTQFTNRVTMAKNQFNGATTTIGIATDGGVAQAFPHNNFNGCLNHIRAAGVLGLLLDAGEWESAAGSCFVLDSTTLAGTAAGPSSPVLFLMPVFVPTTGQHCGTIFSGGQLIFIAPFLGNTSVTKINGAGNCNSILALGIQNGGGAAANFDGYATNHWEIGHSNGHVSNIPLTFIEMAAASVTTPPAGQQKMFLNSADHKWSRKDSTGAVTAIG